MQGNGTSKGGFLRNVIQGILLGLLKIREFLGVNMTTQILLVMQGPIINAGYNTTVVAY